MPLTTDNNHVKIVEKVKDLGVFLDSHLSVDAQISHVIRITGYHLRKCIDADSTKKLVHNFVISGLDHCNYLYHDLPKYKLKKCKIGLHLTEQQG